MIGSSFPRVRHLPGSHAASDDLHWTGRAAERFLTEPVVVVEKVDGINVTFARGHRGRVDFALKADWARALKGQLAREVHVYARQRERALMELVGDGLHFHAEWLWHRVSLSYARIPDAILGTSLLDARGRFMERLESDARIARAGFAVVRPLFVGVLRSARRLRALGGPSAYGAKRMEGVVLSLRDDVDPETRWAKWVSPSYRHVKAGTLSGETNALATGR